MRKFLMSFLLVTVAAVPTVAMAQRGDYAARGGERGLERRGGGGDGGGRSQRAQRSAPAPQAQVQQATPAPQAQVSDRRSNGQSRSAVRTPDTMNTSPQTRRWEGRDGVQRAREGRSDDQQRRYGWNRGGVGQPASPPPIAVPQQPRQDWNSQQRDRRVERSRGNDDRNRVEDRRRSGDRDRWDGNRRDRDDRRYAYRSPNGRDDSSWHNRSWYNNDDRYQRWNNDWRRDRRYDWRGYRSQNRNYYRLPRYSHPYGYNYGYRRFSIGIFLDNLFYSDRYWINDPFEYRLPPAYGPYRWVRYYDDVLLVDLRNGRVVDVIHDFFY